MLSNNYKILENKINMELLLININTNTYGVNIECIKDINDQFNKLIINAHLLYHIIF